jgi:hypothetical protein
MALSNAQQIDRQIDKTHLKTDKQIIPHVKRALPTATTKQIKAENATRPKDAHPHDKANYYIPIFSTHPHAFQIDLLEQSRDRNAHEYPHYFFLAININTRYAYAFPQEDKTQNSILASLKRLVQASRVVSIVSDQESGLVSQKVIDYLNEKKISLKTITEQRHTPLAMVDSLIRTLRNMNTPTVKTQRTSDNPKYRDFSIHRMDKLINIHNSTISRATGHTPEEMTTDPKLERSYIITKLYERERRTKITDANLPEGQDVRYILDRDPMKKKRYKVSPEYYKVAGKDGMSYIITARDGTTKTVSRWRLFPVRDVKKLKFGATFGNNRGELESIESYNPRTKKFNVSFKMPDGTHYKDTITRLDIRGSNPQLETPLEKAYFAQHPNA